MRHTAAAAGSQGRHRGRSIARAAAAAGVVGAAAMLAVPGSVGATAAPVSAVCGPTPQVTPVAGYGMTGLAAGVRYQLNSKGLLPVGDANEGNIIEADVPFARTTVSEGPLVDAVAAPVYPGDTAAHLGTALGTFGAPGIPNEPALAESNFPASPGHGTDESFNGPVAAGPVTVGAGSARAQTNAGGGTALGSAGGFAISLPGGAPSVTIESSESASTEHVSGDCVDSVSRSTTGLIDIGGVIRIDGVSGYAAARSDGLRAVPDAQLTIGHVTVGGQEARIDRDGIHVDQQRPVGAGAVAQAEALLQRTLAGADMTIRLLSPITSGAGGAASADAGGVELTIDRTVPATGIPGVPGIVVPGGPVIPLGTPPVPLHIEIVYGAARAGVTATPAVAGGLVSVPSVGGFDTAPPAAFAAPQPPATPSGGVSFTAPPLPASSPAIPAPAGPGAAPAVLAAHGRPIPPRGSAVPVGWLIVALAGSVVASGPLLGYARWQLLAGRV